jgi:putrescine aminotransferase
MEELRQQGAEIAPRSNSAISMTPREKREIENRFGRHVNSGQMRYLKSGHLDVLETNRDGVTFCEPVTGRPYYDCFTSAGSFNVGRHNPVIMRALEEGLESLDLGTHDAISPQKVALAKKLAEIAPGDLSRVIFCAGGGDAIDAAIKLARGATGRSRVISTIKAYHGHTGFALAANGKAHYRQHFEPLIPAFDFVPFNDIAALDEKVTGATAAIIVEPVQGEAGIFPATNEYLREARRFCDERGALLIFDEIQTGFGRTGRMFASEHSGVVPDILTVAKSIGGGLYANAAVIYRPTSVLAGYAEAHPGFHVSTAGGSNLGCHVSLAVIDYIERERLWDNARARGAQLQGALEDLKRENPKIIREVRGVGLMIGIEYLHEFMGPMMSDALAQNGVFAAYSGNAPQVMRFMVPIVITEAEMDDVIRRIRAAVATMKRLLPFALPFAKIPVVLHLLNNEKVQTALFSWVRRVEDVVGAVKGARR